MAAATANAVYHATGTRVRSLPISIEKLLGQRVFLDLHVKVAKDWQTDPNQLSKLGF